MTRSRSILAAALLTLVPAAARAQLVARDTVRLRDGGGLHGTIAEEVPGRGIVIVLVTGETRRVAAGDIATAGPEAPARLVPAILGPTGQNAPPIVNPVAPQAGFSVQSNGTVSVRFESSDPGTTLHRLTGSAFASSSVFVAGHYGYGFARSDSFERLCAGRCAFTAPIGTHDLALSVPGHDPVVADPITLDRPGVLRGEYHSRAGIRAVGWTIFIAGMVGSLALLTGAATRDHGDEPITQDETAMGMVYGSLGLLALSPLVALPFTMQRDRAELQYEAH